MMKQIAILAALVASASAFAPSSRCVYDCNQIVDETRERLNQKCSNELFAPLIVGMT
jgi:hypothetical protein